MQVVFKDIKWDTDGEQDVPELPTEVTIETNTLADAKAVARDMGIANTLSDEYDFCIDSIGSIEVYDNNGKLVEV